MGLGKTLTSIAVMEAFFRCTARTYKSMVVCPSSLVGNWVKEFKRWACFKLEYIAITTGSKAEDQLQTFRSSPKYAVTILSYEVGYINVIFDIVCKAQKCEAQIVKYNVAIVEHADVSQVLGHNWRNQFSETAVLRRRPPAQEYRWDENQ